MKVFEQYELVGQLRQCKVAVSPYALLVRLDGCIDELVVAEHRDDFAHSVEDYPPLLAKESPACPNLCRIDVMNLLQVAVPKPSGENPITVCLIVVGEVGGLIDVWRTDQVHTG